MRALIRLSRNVSLWGAVSIILSGCTNIPCVWQECDVCVSLNVHTSE